MERSTANRIVGDGLLQSKMHSLAGQRLTDHPHLVGRRGVLFTTCHFINPKACHPEPSEGSLTVSLADTENIQRWKSPASPAPPAAYRLRSAQNDRAL